MTWVSVWPKGGSRVGGGKREPCCRVHRCVSGAEWHVFSVGYHRPLKCRISFWDFRTSHVTFLAWRRLTNFLRFVWHRQALALMNLCCFGKGGPVAPSNPSCVHVTQHSHLDNTWSPGLRVSTRPSEEEARDSREDTEEERVHERVRKLAFGALNGKSQGLAFQNSDSVARCAWLRRVRF